MSLNPLKLVGLFAGIGGIEAGFHDALGEAVRTELLCEVWTPAQDILRAHFPESPITSDIRFLDALPSDAGLVSAGFPCQDLSQAGRTAGIAGSQSGLVSHVFELLDRHERDGHKLPWLLIENVQNMLVLDRGEAMAYLVREVEKLGYRWAYRLVDSRTTGLPQRRKRVIFLASATEDPRPVLFSDETTVRDEPSTADAFGFYWTEGRRVLGWAPDAVPTLKGGSTIGIPSPPAVWIPGEALERRLVTPTIEDAEALQGFPRGWTGAIAGSPRAEGTRWKLVGNAVTRRVAAWVAGSLERTSDGESFGSRRLPNGNPWPKAAWGESGKVYAVDRSEFPILGDRQSLLDVVNPRTAKPLSLKAATGFRNRLMEGNLGHFPGFREDVKAYTEMLADTYDSAFTAGEKASA